METYETVKTETVNLFNGTTFRKIFSSDDDSDQNKAEPITSLSEHVEQLKKTIESSKFFMNAIFEKIRHEGKIKIINELNNNPKHPEYQSSFPDLFNITPKPNNQNSFYPFVKLNENFDLEGRKNILEIDKNFRIRMTKNIQESYYNDFSNDASWKVSDRLNSSENINSAIKYFHKNYENLKLSDELDKKFMDNSYPTLYIVNNNLIFFNDKSQMIQDFKKIVPDHESQKLISAYANEKFLYQSYLQLISENPEIEDYEIKNSRNIYKIDYLNDGSIKLVATNLSDLDVKNDNYIPKYKSFGIRATAIISPNNLPIMKYSHFTK